MAIEGRTTRSSTAILALLEIRLFFHFRMPPYSRYNRMTYNLQRQRMPLKQCSR